MVKPDLDYVLDACNLAKNALPVGLEVDFDLVTELVKDSVINGAVYAPYKLARMFPNHPDWPEFPDTCDNIIEVGERPRMLINSIISKAYELRDFDVAIMCCNSVPFFIFTNPGDSKVGKEHRDLEGKIFSINDPKYAAYVQRFRWGCRCGTIGFSARGLVRRGHQDKPISLFPL